jgi:hypothetical protein
MISAADFFGFFSSVFSSIAGGVSAVWMVLDSGSCGRVFYGSHCFIGVKSIPPFFECIRNPIVIPVEWWRYLKSRKRFQSVAISVLIGVGFLRIKPVSLLVNV